MRPMSSFCLTGACKHRGPKVPRPERYGTTSCARQGWGGGKWILGQFFDSCETNHGRGGPDMHAAACIINIASWAKRHVGRMVILRASITYVITSYVASAAEHMGLMAGNRISVQPRRYYRGLLTRCPRPDTLILTAPSPCPQPSSLAALARQLTCATFSCLRLPVGKADTASCSCAPPSWCPYTALIDRWLQRKGARLRRFNLWAEDVLCIHRRQPSPRQSRGSGEVQPLERRAPSSSGRSLRCMQPWPNWD